jgi:gluconate 2-dehydrogenase gamma chain
MEKSPTRRRFLVGAGSAVATSLGATAAKGQATQAVAGTPSDSAQSSVANVPVFQLLTATEVAFYGAVADEMIPADELTPSASDCGVVIFIDRQLASAWGGGARLYRSGPFRTARPEYGYQLSLSPKEFFAAGVVATNQWTRKQYGHEFDRLPKTRRIEVLKTMEAGKAALNGVDAKQFFDALLDLVMEGFFADPMYGGNKDKLAWKMVGFPGLPALYKDLALEYRGRRYDVPPKSIADFS